MSQAVVIKSNKYGIHLVLSNEISFKALLDAIVEKFKESEKHTLDILLKGNLKMRGLALMSFRKKSHLGNIPT